MVYGHVLSLPIGTSDRHVSLDDPINPDPAVFGCITIERNAGTLADETTPAIGANQILAASI